MGPQTSGPGQQHGTAVRSLDQRPEVGLTGRSAQEHKEDQNGMDVITHRLIAIRLGGITLGNRQHRASQQLRVGTASQMAGSEPLNSPIAVGKTKAHHFGGAPSLYRRPDLQLTYGGGAWESNPPEPRE